MRSSILEATFWKTELKKNITLICFIEITSILAYAKVQLNQAVKPYPFGVVKRRLLISYCDILKILKMKFFSSLMFKIFRSHLTWKLSWTPSHKWSHHYFNEREQDWTSHYKRVYHGPLQAMKHGSQEQP